MKGDTPFKSWEGRCYRPFWGGVARFSCDSRANPGKRNATECSVTVRRDRITVAVEPLRHLDNIFLCAGTTPNFEKKRSENAWVNENLPCGFPSIPGIAPRVAPRIVVFALHVRRHSENGISHSENYFLNSESCSENTLERSQSSENSLFTPRAFFLKLGWSPGFWNMTQNASKQGKFDGFAAILLFIFVPCMWELGFQNDSPPKMFTFPIWKCLLRFFLFWNHLTRLKITSGI